MKIQTKPPYAFRYGIKLQISQSFVHNHNSTFFRLHSESNFAVHTWTSNCVCAQSFMQCHLISLLLIMSHSVNWLMPHYYPLIIFSLWLGGLINKTGKTWALLHVCLNKANARLYYSDEKNAFVHIFLVFVLTRSFRGESTQSLMHVASGLAWGEEKQPELYSRGHCWTKSLLNSSLPLPPRSPLLPSLSEKI